MAQSSTVEKVKSYASSASNALHSNIPNIPGEIKEGELTKAIESQTAKLPSVSFLTMALGSIGLSAGIALFSERKSLANFFGLWAPTFLLLGIYNKLVKLEGSDAFNRPESLSGSSSNSYGSSSRDSGSSLSGVSSVGSV